MTDRGIECDLFIGVEHADQPVQITPGALHPQFLGEQLDTVATVLVDQIRAGEIDIELTEALEIPIGGDRGHRAPIKVDIQLSGDAPVVHILRQRRIDCRFAVERRKMRASLIRHSDELTDAMRVVRKALATT